MKSVWADLQQNALDCLQYQHCLIGILQVPFRARFHPQNAFTYVVCEVDDVILRHQDKVSAYPPTKKTTFICGCSPLNAQNARKRAYVRRARRGLIAFSGCDIGAMPHMHMRYGYVVVYAGAYKRAKWPERDTKENPDMQSPYPASVRNDSAFATEYARSMTQRQASPYPASVWDDCAFAIEYALSATRRQASAYPASLRNDIAFAIEYALSTAQEQTYAHASRMRRDGGPRPHNTGTCVYVLALVGGKYYECMYRYSEPECTANPECTPIARTKTTATPNRRVFPSLDT